MLLALFLCYKIVHGLSGIAFDEFFVYLLLFRTGVLVAWSFVVRMQYETIVSALFRVELLMFEILGQAAKRKS